MAIEIFNRVEMKYLITIDEYNNIMNKVSKYLKHNIYYKSKILNIYFDNDNYDLVINSLEKPMYKEKVRLRSYEVPNEDSNVFLEIKKKYNGVVYKRRITLSMDDLVNYFEKGILKDKQIFKEIDYVIKLNDLKPKVFIGYDRLSYEAVDDPEFRVTFDKNIKYRENDLDLRKGDYGVKLLDDKMIMEVKSLGSMPLWFTSVLDEYKIYPDSFSKYGEAYKQIKGGDVYV